MEVEFGNKDCDRLETDPDFNAGYSRAIVKAYRKRMQAIRAAVDERLFYAMKSLHYEKLSGDRSHQHSMRLNRQWRLILELRKKDAATVVFIVGIEDYH
jgi:proteic killer suppression protein